MSLKAWDCETTIATKFKRKGTPFEGVNWCVTHAFAGPDQLHPTEHRFGLQRPGPGWFKPVLEGCTLLAGFNIKFDLLHALQDSENLAAWMKWVADGGQVWDCQLAEYLLEGMDQSAHMLSLEEVALKYGGTVKEDAVKALWNAGVDTHEIEPGLLTRYLCGDGTNADLGDVRNTMLICRKQLALARERGQLKSILLNMGSLLCTVEMERNGMFVDRNRGLQIAEQLAQELVDLNAALQEFIPADFPIQFNWTNRYHLSPLIFGGKIKYERRSYELKDGTRTWEPANDDVRYAYAQKDEEHYILEDGSTCSLEEFEEERRGCEADGEPFFDLRVKFVSGKRAGEYKTKKVKVDDYTKPKSRMDDCYYEFPGYTKPDKKWESTPPGLYKVGSDVIEELGARDIPFLKLLSKVTAMTKDLGTYYIVWDEKGQAWKGMLSLVGDGWIIHHKINHTSTVTARFSSSDPNLQNIPKGNKSKVKTIFVSRFGHWVTDDFGTLQWVPTGKIIQSDFSALEVYVQAILTKCEQLIADLRAGLDMHCKRLAVKEGISYDECYALCKGDKYDKAWDYKRTGAKVFSFQRAYGAGAAKIAASTGMPIEDVQSLIEAEELEYPEISDYFNKRTEEIKKHRKSSGSAVPHPTVPGVFCHLGKSHVRTPDGKVYTYIESPSPEYLVKKGVYSSFSPTEIKNYEVQGEGGEWAKAAMWLAVREFYRMKCWGGRGLLVNQVHDAVYADADDSVKLEVAATLHACMEAASDFMEWYFDWPVPVPVPSDTTWGKSMLEEYSIPGCKELAATIRKDLRSRYMGGYTPSFIN